MILFFIALFLEIVPFSGFIFAALISKWKKAKMYMFSKDLFRLKKGREWADLGGSLVWEVEEPDHLKSHPIHKQGIYRKKKAGMKLTLPLYFANIRDFCF